MADVPGDGVGPRGRALRDFAWLVAAELHNDPELSRRQQLHTAFTWGLELGLALQASDPAWTRDALAQFHRWQEQRWGEDAQREREELLRDTRLLRDLARRHGDG